MQTITLDKLYGGCDDALERYKHLREQFAAHFKGISISDISYYSAPGRCEIIGNHTDHNGGRVIAASINMDTIAAAAPNGTDIIRIYSEGHDYIEVSLGDLNRHADLQEQMTLDSYIGYFVSNYSGSAGLVAGICQKALEAGYIVKGFDAYITTKVIAAAGVSSSASYEMLICAIINFMFNDNIITENECAHFGQYAENVFWNKSSGLMDQITCAVGGAVYMDFRDKEEVTYKKADISFEKMGYKLVITNTGKGHADLSHEYSSIPEEMYSVARACGCERLCEMDMGKLISNINLIDNDRAVLRAIHFFNENERVDKMYDAIGRGDTDTILNLIGESGTSSWELLQNCYCSDNVSEQKICLALALSKDILASTGCGAVDVTATGDVNGECPVGHADTCNRRGGVCRVHGGGFAGVIMSVVPVYKITEYTEYMSKFFGQSNVHVVDVRQFGAVRVEV